MTTRRVRPEHGVIDSWDAADEALRQLAELGRRLQAFKTMAEQRIEDAKRDFKKQSAPIKAQLEVVERKLEDFVTLHTGDFAPARSKKLRFGKVGFRAATSLEVPDEEATLKALTLRELVEAIIVKRSIDKKALAKFADDTLEAVGAVRRTVARFFYELPKVPPETERHTPPGGAS